MSEKEINTDTRENIINGTYGHNLSSLNNDGVSALLNMGNNGSRENLGPLDEPLSQDEADRLAHARVLSPEDYVNRIPLPKNEKRQTLGQSVLRLFGKKPS